MKKVFDHTNHKKMWSWLLENPGYVKTDWPEREDGDNPNARNGCFACDYAGTISETNLVINCENCPLQWPDSDNTQCPCDDHEESLFTKWSNAEDICDMIEFASEIANLPLKNEDIETK